MIEENKPQSAETWSFPKEFWLANAMELFERAAYYGFFIIITLYLNQVAGFSDIESGIISGLFSGGLYLLPPFVGIIGDRIGFKNGLILAFALLTIAYLFLGLFTSKFVIIFFLIIGMIGGAFIKPLITGTVSKTTDEVNRARGYALFYWVVNIGAFSGKTFVPYIRQGLGLDYVSLFSAGMTLLAMLFAIFFFKPLDKIPEKRKFKDVLDSLMKIVLNGRLMGITLIVTGFWIIQHQLYASMPKYVIRLLGEEAKPEWLANVNPLTVVIFVVLVTQMMKKTKAVSSITVGMFLMPFSALAMAMSTSLESVTGASVSIFSVVSLHPLIIMMIIGIAIQGLAECFISPRFLEYFSLQAPKGQEGMYLGFSHLHSFLSSVFAFSFSGFLLDKYVPDPRTLPVGITEAQKAVYYADAHYIWYYFLAIGMISAIALLIFKVVVDRADKKLEAEQAK